MRSCLLLAYLTIISTSLWPQDLAVYGRYTGAVTGVLSDRGTYNQREPLVLRSQEDFETFTTFIPIRQIFKTETLQPSKDPLLGKPVFAWDRFMILVVFDQRSLIFPPRVVQVAGNTQGVNVYYRSMSRLDALETKPQNVGSYCAVVLDKTDIPIQFHLLP